MAIKGASLVVAIFATLMATTALAQQPASDEPRATVDNEGIVHIPAMAVPLSPYMSEEARQAFKKVTKADPSAKIDWETATFEEQRRYVDDKYRSLIERAKALYPVRISNREFAGVRTQVVEPVGGVRAHNQKRILINLHGGSYRYASAGLARLIEAIPVAGRGKFKVFSVDYRTSPNYKFPAAVQDVITVYRELLKTYKPQSVGIYGCSTGAALTAVAVAWIQREKLPRPGAIGLFCEGAIKDDQIEGDSYYLAPPLMGARVPRLHSAFRMNAYMADTDGRDPYVAPMASLDVLAKFPPTLLLSGTRDVGLSGILYTQSRLTQAGVQAELHVWEGMWHGFFSDVDLPESTEAYDVIGNFFDRHLRVK